MMLHTYTINQCPYQVLTFYALWITRNSPDKMFKVKVTTAGSKVRSRLHHDVCTPTPPQSMSLPIINFLHLIFSEIQPRQTFPTFPARLPIWTPWVKTIP